MKNAAVVIVLFTLLNTALSQETKLEYWDQVDNIVNDYRRNDPYSAIIKLDEIAKDYFGEEDVFFNRGMLKFELRDIHGAREDFIKCNDLGYKFNNFFLKAVISDKYLIDIFSEGYFEKDELLVENGYKPIYGIKDSLHGALRNERTCYDVYYYDLTVKLLPNQKSIEGLNNIYLKALDSTGKIQIDLSENYNIKSIKLDGKELQYERVFDAIFIQFEEGLIKNNNYCISIDYYGKPREAPDPPWNGGFIWEKKKSKHWVGVACEHLGASSWWPCKDHLSDKPDSMTINVQVPSKYKGISNGNLISESEIKDGYTNYEWFVSYPINSYCVTLYMGNFVNFNEKHENNSGDYNIDYYVLPHNLKKAKNFYSQTKDIIEVYEKLYGEYPYKNDGVALVESPYEGMEHQSAIAIGGDYGKSQRRNYINNEYDYLVVHELAHEWWGNTVTMSDMADAWISEAFATYSEHLFLEEKFGYEEYISATASNMRLIFNVWPMVGIKDVNDNTFMGGDIYNKGAAMLHNLRCIINDDTAFFALIKKFYNTNKFRTITSADFVNFVNVETNTDFTDFFNVYLYGKEPPILEYSFKKSLNKFEFTYKWINVGEEFIMPFCLIFSNEESVRLVGTSENQTYADMNFERFYIANEFDYDIEYLKKNSLTYFWTNWKH